MKIKSWTGDDVDAFRKEALSSYEYDSVHGLLTWKSPAPNRVKAGHVAGSVGSEGYLRVFVSGKRYFVHQVIWLLHNQSLPDNIDHINHNKIDNRISNLRAASKTNNAANSSMRPDNKSGFKGVCYSRKAQKWMAQIRVCGVNKFIGHFEIPELAAHAYNKAAIKYHGEFASLNPVGGFYA